MGWNASQGKCGTASCISHAPFEICYSQGYTNLQRSSISEYDIEYHDGEGDVQNSDDDNNENTEMHHNVEMQRVNEEEIEESINMSMNVDVESDNEFYGYEMSS